MRGFAVILALSVSASSPFMPGDEPSTVIAPHESSTQGGIRPIEKQFKGRFDSIGPFRWSDLGGRVWTERDFNGKVLIAVQWAAWCGPCIAEFPQVQQLFETVRNDPSIAFVSLDMDQDPAEIRQFLLEFRKEYSFPVLFAGAQLKINALPCTWIVDREGYIRDGFANAGADFVEDALALADAVKRRPPVASLPQDVREDVRKRNQRNAANSR